MAGENYEEEYDSAFDEATGGEPAVPADPDPAAETDSEGESGEATVDVGGDAEGTHAEDDDATEEGDGAAPASGDKVDPEGDVGAAQEGDSAETGDGGAEAAEAAAGEKPAVYDEETVRKAAELIREQTQKGGNTEPEAAEEPQQTEEAVDYSQMSWEDYIPEDKKAVVQKYKEEWGEVHEAEEVIRNAQLQLVQDKLYSDLRSALAPVFETTQKLQVNAHLDSIRQAHPDLDTIKPELNEWINQQPEFVRPAYQQVAQKGSAAQVVELVNQFKQSTGKTSAVPEVPASSARQQPQQRKPAQKQPPAAAKKALAAAPSPSTAEVPGSARSDDFDAAWEEAAGLG